MSRKIIGVTVGTTISPKTIKDKINPVTSINGVEPDETGNVDISGDTTIDSTLSVEGTAADAKATGERITALESKMADLLYEAIKITSFTNNVGTVEMGRTITEVTFTWRFSKTPVSVMFNGETVAIDSTGTTLTGLSLTSNKTWSLKATDDRGAAPTASTGVSFLNGVYYGVLEDGTEIDSSVILGFTKKLQGSRGMTFTVNAGATQRIAFAIPARYGTPTINIGGFDYEFEKTTFDFTNASGYTESYDVYMSSQTGLGDTTLKIS